MNLRHIVGLSCFAALAWSLVGCSSGPTRPAVDVAADTWEIGDRPRMTFPGATPTEVKALAMGAARSRAWSIAESTSDRLVIQRPLDPASPVARQVSPAGVMPGTLIEVTSYFLQEYGDTKVALDATVISQTPGQPPVRTDHTETFRPALNESLSSLHDNWVKNRARLARAAPPLGGAAADAAGDLDASSDSAQTSSSGSVAERRPSSWTNEAAAAVIAPTPSSSSTPTSAATPRTTGTSPGSPTPSSAASRAASPSSATTTPPARSVNVPPASRAPAAQVSQTSPERRAGATSSPWSRSSAPAPVVDGTTAYREASRQPMTLPEPAGGPRTVAETMPAGPSMLALGTSVSAAGTDSMGWSYYAEQHARLRGCNVSIEGATLVDSRSDGEIHRVPCDGSDSVLVQCYQGECRSLL